MRLVFRCCISSLALTTTIVGGVGSYLMRLVKTMLTGAALHEHYEAASRRDFEALTALVARIDRRLSHLPPLAAAAGPGAGAPRDG